MKPPPTKEAKRCAKVFGEEMLPCPNCGSYRLSYALPLKMEKVEQDGQIVVRPEIKGPIKILCRACNFFGPSVDVSGRSYDDVSRDPAVFKATRAVWNAIERCPACSRATCECSLSFSA